MGLLQLCHEVHACLNLLGCVLQLTVLNPRFAVYTLQIVYQEDGPVVFHHSQRVIIFIVSLKLGSRLQKGSFIRRNLTPNLIKGSLIPVEQTSCQGNRHRHQLAVCLALVQAVLGKLGQVQDIAVVLQICKVGPVAAVGCNPVPVNLHNISRISSLNGKGLLLFPSGPGSVFAFHLNVRILCHECVHCLLSCLMSGVTAPPAELDGHVLRSTLCFLAFCLCRRSGPAAAAAFAGCQ